MYTDLEPSRGEYVQRLFPQYCQCTDVRVINEPLSLCRISVLSAFAGAQSTRQELGRNLTSPMEQDVSIETDGEQRA